MRLAGAVLVALSPFAALAGAAPADGELARCAAIADRDARLACYDALAAPRGAASTANGGSGRPAAAAPAAAAERVSAPPAATTSAVAAKPPVTAPPSGAATGGVERFGLTAAQLHEAPAGPESIDAIVSGVSESRTGITTVTLNNGQTWVVAESGVRVGTGETVTIRRASLGSYLMLTPSRHSYRARRAR